VISRIAGIKNVVVVHDLYVGFVTRGSITSPSRREVHCAARGFGVVVH